MAQQSPALGSQLAVTGSGEWIEELRSMIRPGQSVGAEPVVQGQGGRPVPAGNTPPWQADGRALPTHL